MRNVTFASGLIAVAVTVLVACGGGSSSNTATTPTTPTTPVTPTPPALVNPVTVVPALGGFSAGANFAFLQPNGTVIGKGTTDGTGTAVVPLGTYSGPFISQVTGGPNVTVYNERTQGYEAFGATNSLLAIVPSTVGFTTGAARLGVTPFTNAAAAVLIPNPASPSIPGSTATIQAAVAQANATVAVSLGLPPGASLLTAPAPLTSPTSKITTTDPNVALLSALLTSLELSSKGSLLATVSGLATDAAANKGALPASAALIISATAQLSSVVSQNVAPASLTSFSTSLTTLVSNVKPDPTLSNPASLASISTQATAANGGVTVAPPVIVPVPSTPTTETGTTSTTTSGTAGSKPPAPPAPPTPNAQGTGSGGSGSSGATAAPTLSPPVTFYATVANTTSSLDTSYTTFGSATPSVTGVTWSSTYPTFATSGNNVFAYTQVTNSGNADGTYTTTSTTLTGQSGITVNAGQSVYLVNSTSSNTSGIVLPNCPSSTDIATASGTITVTTNGSTFGYTADVINGVIYGFFPSGSASGASGSGLFTGTVTGASGGSAGLVLGSGSTSNLGFASGSNNAVNSSSNILIGSKNFNVVQNSTASIVLQCQ